MGVLTSKLIVSLLDRTGAGARSAKRNILGLKAAAAGAAGAAGGIGPAYSQATRDLRRHSRTMRAFRTVGGPAGNAGMAGLGATAGAFYFLKSQFDFEKALNDTQSKLNIVNKEAFQPLRNEIVRLAKTYPAMRKEIALGTTEMAQAGMPINTIIATLENTIQGSMAAGESIKTVAAGVTDVVLGMGMPFETAAEQAASFGRVNNVLAASATSANDSYTGFLAGLSKAAPVARALGVDLQTVAAAHGVLANAGIKAERAGTAMRTMMVRMVAPTKKAREMLAGANLDMSEFIHLTPENLSSKGLIGAVRTGLGGDVSGQSAAIEKIISDPRLQKNVGVMGDKLVDLLSAGLNIRDGDVEAQAQLNNTIRDYLFSTAAQLDLKGAFKYLGDNNAGIGIWKELFGVRHIEKAATLIEQMASGKFDEVLEAIVKKSPGAVERMARIQMQGFVGAVARMASAWDGFLETLANTGVLDTLTNFFTDLTSGINKLGQANPAFLKFATYALLIGGLLAPVGIIASGLGAMFTIVAAGARLALAPVVALAGAIWRLSAGLTAANAASARGAMAGLFAGGYRGNAGASKAASARMVAGMGKGGQMISGMSAAGGGVAAMAAPGLVGRVSKLGGAIKALGSGLGLVAQYGARLALVGSGLGAIVAAGTWLVNNASNLKSAFVGFAEGAGLMEPLTTAFNAVGKAIQWVVDGLKWLGSFLGPSGTASEWKDWGRDLGKGFRDNALMNALFGKRKESAKLPKLSLMPDETAVKEAVKATAAANDNTPSPAGSQAATGAAGPRQTANHLGDIEQQAKVIPMRVRDSMAEVKQILAGVDLSADGERMMNTLAAGIRRGGAAVRAATQEAAANNVRNAVRGAYSDGAR